MQVNSKQSKTMTGTEQREPICVEERGAGPFQVQVVIGATRVQMDEPIDAGGQNEGPNPYDLLCAAVGSCTLMTMRLYADRKSWPMRDTRVSVGFRRSADGHLDEIERVLSFDPRLDEVQRARLVQIAERCPVHLTLTRGVTIKTTAPSDQGGQVEGCLDDRAHADAMDKACREP